MAAITDVVVLTAPLIMVGLLRIPSTKISGEATIKSPVLLTPFANVSGACFIPLDMACGAVPLTMTPTVLMRPDASCPGTW